MNGPIAAAIHGHERSMLECHPAGLTAGAAATQGRGLQPDTERRSSLAQASCPRLASTPVHCSQVLLPSAGLGCTTPASCVVLPAPCASALQDEVVGDLMRGHDAASTLVVQLKWVNRIEDLAGLSGPVSRLDDPNTRSRRVHVQAHSVALDLVGGRPPPSCGSRPCLDRPTVCVGGDL